jgi:hypothetical protein
MSENNSELAAQQSQHHCTGDTQPRGDFFLKSFRGLEAYNLVTAVKVKRTTSITLKMLHIIFWFTPT